MKVRGIVDNISNYQISGWVNFNFEPTENVIIQSLMNNTVVDETIPVQARPDISLAGWNKGFVIKLDLLDILEKISDGSLILRIKYRDHFFCLDIWRPLTAANYVNSLLDHEISTFIKQISQVKKLQILDQINNSALITASKRPGIHCGRISDDEAVILGRNGNIFLRSGSNNLFKIYTDLEFVNVNSWHEKLLHRITISKKIKASFIQIFIPEKSSVIYWKTPYPAEKGSKGWHSLMERLKADASTKSNVFDFLSKIENKFESEIIFRPFDSHLSTFGCLKLVNNFVNDYFPNTIFYTGNETIIDLHSDLGGRFTDDGDVLEKSICFDSLKNFEGKELKPEIIRQFTPSTGHLNTRIIWHCPLAPISKKVICFGNSFFERGSASISLSWWFSRLFSEFHFIWSPHVDEDYLIENRPDIVIGQTIERFLGTPPNS